MRTKYLGIISIAVFSVLVIGLVGVQTSFQQANPCADGETPMMGPTTNEVECVTQADEGKYRSDGYVTVKTVKGQGVVPDWVKNSAKWYGDGTVSQTEFIDAIKHLVDNKVIKLSDAKNIQKNMLDAKHKVTITDLRFLQCIDLHDEYVKMGEGKFHDVYSHKAFLNICVNFYKDPVWSSGYLDDPRELYESFKEYAATGADKSNFQQCMLLHRNYVQMTESQFVSEFSDKDYIEDCVTLYEDSIWQYDDTDRMKQLYSRFTEIETDRTGQASASNAVHSEITQIQDLGDGAFNIEFNACAGDTIIHHAKFLIKSSTDSAEIGSYKDIEPNTCRTYSATIHGENSNDFEIHLMEAVQKDHIETQDNIKPLTCAPGWEVRTDADGKESCKAKQLSQQTERAIPSG